ncbi:AraC family transcriptional regulator [Rhodoligotrophos defluvii]|uniref:AraC family transcriptional regulator n=1 Tax=Rhodoligotrophos defluvii TaxID=2561934 RepID=UPI0010CA0F3D|nr:AraC family transcriptional regulator [Rhodoligotrophos defluvii]
MSQVTSRSASLSNYMNMMRGAEIALRTSSIDEAQKHVSTVFSRQRIRVERPSFKLDFLHRHIRLPDFSVHRVRYGAPVWKEVVVPTNFVALQITLAGECIVFDGAREIVTGPGQMSVINSGRRFEKFWSRDAEQLMVCIDRRPHRGAATSVSPRASLNGITFDTDPVSAERVPLLAGVVAAICADFDSGSGCISDPEISRQMFETLVLLMRRGLPHHDAAAPGPASQPAPYYIIRSEAFLSQNLAAEITLEDIAQAAGVSSRTLCNGYRRFRGTTPMARLRDLRLKRAREMLVSAEGGTTVRDVAGECGLNHLGRFSRYYAERFGEHPSFTLARSQKRH